MRIRMGVLLGIAATVSVAAPAQPNQPAGVSEGLRFRVAFTQPIDTATAAVGDRIRAMLKTDIRDAEKHFVVAPEGAGITARIVRLDHVSGEKALFRMEVRLEAVEVGGVSVPLKAEASPATDSNRQVMPRAPLLSLNSTTSFLPREAPANQPRIGQLRGVPAVYVWEFRDEKPGFVVIPGLESSWVTAK